MTQAELKQMVKDLPKEFDSSEVTFRQGAHGPAPEGEPLFSYHELNGFQPVTFKRGSHPQVRRALVVNVG